MTYSQAFTRFLQQRKNEDRPAEEGKSDNEAELSKESTFAEFQSQEDPKIVSDPDDSNELIDVIEVTDDFEL